MRLTLGVLLFVLGSSAPAADWPQWGGGARRNAVSPEKDPPVDFAFPDRAIGKQGRNIAWQTDLGTRTLVPPVIADGLVWVCTNTRDPNGEDETIPAKDWDGGLLMCLRESDGKMLWNHRTPRLPFKWPVADEAFDHRRYREDPSRTAIGSAPLVEGDRLWYLNNRSEVVCLDIAPLKKRTGEPHEAWKRDLRKEFKVVPQVDPCPAGTPGFGASVGGYKDWLYVVTRNSAVEGRVPAPDAPSLLCLEKATGKLVWKDNSPGKEILEYQMSSPLVVEVKGKPQVIVGQGDGWLRSFDGATGKLIWKCDLNGKDAERGGEWSRDYVVATPVMYDGRIYVATGRDALQGDGPGTLFCIDPTKTGDVSVDLENGPKRGKPNPDSAVVWHTPRQVPNDAPRVLRSRGYFVGRMVANVTVHDGLLYAADVHGVLHCLDAKTGKLHWVDDLRAIAIGQPLLVDGKVIVTTQGGDVFIYAHGKEGKRLAKLETDERFDAGAIYANGTLFLAGSSTLFAVRNPKP